MSERYTSDPFEGLSENEIYTISLRGADDFDAVSDATYNAYLADPDDNRFRDGMRMGEPQLRNYPDVEPRELTEEEVNKFNGFMRSIESAANLRMGPTGDTYWNGPKDDDGNRTGPGASTKLAQELATYIDANPRYLQLITENSNKRQGYLDNSRRVMGLTSESAARHAEVSRQATADLNSARLDGKQQEYADARTKIENGVKKNRDPVAEDKDTHKRLHTWRGRAVDRFKHPGENHHAREHEAYDHYRNGERQPQPLLDDKDKRLLDPGRESEAWLLGRPNYAARASLRHTNVKDRIASHDKTITRSEMYLGTLDEVFDSAEKNFTIDGRFDKSQERSLDSIVDDLHAAGRRAQEQIDDPGETLTNEVDYALYAGHEKAVEYIYALDRAIGSIDRDAKNGAYNMMLGRRAEAVKATNQEYWRQIIARLSYLEDKGINNDGHFFGQYGADAFADGGVRTMSSETIYYHDGSYATRYGRFNPDGSRHRSR